MYHTPKKPDTYSLSGFTPFAFVKVLSTVIKRRMTLWSISDVVIFVVGRVLCSTTFTGIYGLDRIEILLIVPK